MSEPQATVLSSEASADEAVEHFFEGLDEDAFIANLQVVSAWDSDDDKAKPAHQESALSKFKSYLSHDEEPRAKPVPDPNVQSNPSVSAPLGIRRDPDKTKRDIEKDKVNKSKDNLIKKMVTGLIPPGMEMENAESVDNKKTNVSKTEQPSNKHTDNANLRKSPPREYSPRDRSRRSSRSHSNKRTSEKYVRSRPYYRRDRARDVSPRRGRRDDSREWRRQPRYRSRSRGSSPRYAIRRKNSRPREDFLTFLSKKNLNSPKYLAQDCPNYNLQSSLPYGMPSADTISVQYPPPPYTSTLGNYNVPVSQSNIQEEGQNSNAMNTYYCAPPDIYNSVMPNTMCPPPYNYSNGYNTAGTFQEASTTVVEQTYADPNVTYEVNNTDAATTTNLTDNLFDSFKDSDGKSNLIKNCEAVVKALKSPCVPNNVTLTSEQDVRQRDNAFAPKPLRKEDQHCSPLNRESTSYYNYTQTGSKHKLLVPIVMSTIGDGASETKPKSIMKDVGVQTIRNTCDKCQCCGSFKMVDAFTTPFGKAFTKSVYSQVKEEDLASSKIIFTPNQNSSSEPQKPVSLTHMTPAQILVAELTAKAKSLQRSAVDSYRLTGTVDDQTMRFNTAFEELKHERNFSYQQSQLFQNNSFKPNNTNNDSMSQNYNTDLMKKRVNKNNKNPW